MQECCWTGKGILIRIEGIWHLLRTPMGNERDGEYMHMSGMVRISREQASYIWRWYSKHIAIEEIDTIYWIIIVYSI